MSHPAYSGGLDKQIFVHIDLLKILTSHSCRISNFHSVLSFSRFSFISYDLSLSLSLSLSHTHTHTYFWNFWMSVGAVVSTLLYAYMVSILSLSPGFISVGPHLTGCTIQTNLPISSPHSRISLGAVYWNHYLLSGFFFLLFFCLVLPKILAAFIATYSEGEVFYSAFYK